MYIRVQCIVYSVHGKNSIGLCKITGGNDRKESKRDAISALNIEIIISMKLFWSVHGLELKCRNISNL